MGCALVDPCAKPDIIWTRFPSFYLLALMKPLDTLVDDPSTLETPAEAPASLIASGASLGLGETWSDWSWMRLPSPSSAAAERAKIGMGRVGALSPAKNPLAEQAKSQAYSLRDPTGATKAVVEVEAGASPKIVGLATASGGAGLLAPAILGFLAPWARMAGAVEQPIGVHHAVGREAGLHHIPKIGFVMRGAPLNPAQQAIFNGLGEASLAGSAPARQALGAALPSLAGAGFAEHAKQALPAASPAQVSHALRLAACYGSRECVELLIPLCDPRQPSGNGQVTPLGWAALGGHASCVEALLPFSDPLATCPKGRSPLSLAISRGFVDCVDALLPRSNLLGSCNEGWTPLMAAANLSGDRCSEMIGRVLPGSDPEARNAMGLTALGMAAAACNPEACALLAPATAPSESYFNAILFNQAASADDRDRCLSSLLLAANPFEPISKGGDNPLCSAITHKLPRVVESILDSLSSEDARRLCALSQKDFITPLMAAASTGQAKIARLLLPHSDPAACDIFGRPALSIAAASDSAEMVQLLLPSGDPLASSFSGGLTPLMLAIQSHTKESGDLRCLLLLTPEAAAQRDAAGETPLMQCVRQGLDELLFPVLAASDAAAANHKGQTALMIAAELGRPKMVRDLLPHGGARASALDGSTALMLAASAGCARSVDALLRESDPLARDRSGSDALMRAASLDGRGDSASLARMLLPTADPLARDAFGSTALMRAAAAQNYGAVIELLGDSDLLAANRQGDTPLMCLALSAKASAHPSRHEMLLRAISEMAPASSLSATNFQGLRARDLFDKAPPAIKEYYADVERSISESKELSAIQPPKIVFNRPAARVGELSASPARPRV